MEEKVLDLDLGLNLDVNSEGRLNVLEQLVEELMKPQPHEEKIKGYMKDSGLEYVSDPIDRINCVLEALEFKTVAGNEKPEK